MELSLLRKISKWVSHTNDVGRDNLRHVHLSCIVHYRQVKLNLPLLRTASDFGITLAMSSASIGASFAL